MIQGGRIMERYFNIEGSCHPTEHYMINLEQRLCKIKKIVDRGKYFTINRARQYGKTTTLDALAQYLNEEYLVIEMDFQMLAHEDFKNESAFVSAFSREVLMAVSDIESIPESVVEKLVSFSESCDSVGKLSLLFIQLSKWCAISEKPIVLIIDEVDSAANNQVFLDFLSQLRGYYLHRRKRPTFHSVILAGVYDVKNLKLKIRPEEDHKTNSPWNIAAKFDINMSFSELDIADMLTEYEQDYHTGMDIKQMATLLYDYTEGYPFLVSDLCKIMDEEITGSSNFPDRSAAWTKEGFLEGVKILLLEKNTLFESLINKLTEHPELSDMVCQVLFQGTTITYNPDNYVMDIGLMFGFIKDTNGTIMVANRIFETRLYNYFLSSEKEQASDLNRIALENKSHFVKNGILNLELVLERFVSCFSELYGGWDEKFLEEDGRRYFLLFLRPIINGTGNYYIEARTRDLRRTDIIVDYLGRQYIIELKIWHGEEYNRRGEKQLAEYLEDYHQDKGYLLSFNFNKTKQVGMKEIRCGDKVIVEAVV